MPLGHADAGEVQMNSVVLSESLRIGRPMKVTFDRHEVKSVRGLIGLKRREPVALGHALGMPEDGCSIVHRPSPARSKRSTRR